MLSLADEVVGLLGRGDLLAAAMRLDRELLERHFPGAEYGTFSVHVRDGMPDFVLPIIPQADPALLSAPV